MKNPLDGVDTVGTRDWTRDDETMFDQISEKRLTCSNLAAEANLVSCFSSEIFTMFCQKIFMSVPEEREHHEAAE